MSEHIPRRSHARYRITRQEGLRHAERPQGQGDPAAGRQINALEPEFEALSDDGLIEKTEELRNVSPKARA
jgi:hypothetical protein